MSDRRARKPHTAPVTMLFIRSDAKLDDIIKWHTLEVLKNHDYNMTHAAKSLGISVRTLRSRMHWYRDVNLNELRIQAGLMPYEERKRRSE